MAVRQTAARWYHCRVMHRRLHPVTRRFVYRIGSMLVDIDQLASITHRLRLLSHNRFNLFSIHDRDHGPRDGSPLRPWVDACLMRQGIDLAGGVVTLLAMPRVLGFTFNPLSLYFCHHQNGELRAIIAQVRNTFGEQHCYVLHAADHALPTPVDAEKTKIFHVSPFFPRDLRYRFRIAPPVPERVDIAIELWDNERKLLVATQRGDGMPLTDAVLLRSWLRMPLMTLGVVLGIHWQALRLWLAGLPVFSKPEPPRTEVS